MDAPPIDERSHDDIVAWTERLARCERALPRSGLVGAVLDADVIDPSSATRKVIAQAGKLVDAGMDTAIAAPDWLDVGSLLFAGPPGQERTLGRDVANPANLRVHRAGTTVDAALAQELADLARVVGADVLVGCELARKLTDPVGPRDYEAGTVIDAELAAVIDRLAWVRIRTWRPRPDGEPDLGRALIHIAGHFATLAAERINRAAEKHELAFLNLTGAQPSPPQPARVPLTFTLAAGSPVDALVAAGTQVSATLQEGEEDEVVFETDRSLVVNRAQLQAVFVADAETDTYSDRSEEATGRLDQPFPAFVGDRPTPHELYIACDEALAQPGVKDVALVMASASTFQWTSWPISWAYWDGTGWQRPRRTTVTADGKAWTVTLAGVPPLPPTTVDGRAAGWLRATLGMALPPGRSGLAPDSVAVGNRQPQDLRLPIAPFGETTQVRRFYLSVDEAVGEGGGRVDIHVKLARPGVGRGLKLNWTYRDAVDWQPLTRSGFGFTDGTAAFTTKETDGGVVSFYAPAAWPRTQYRNRMGRWLRVEIADDSGAYTTLPQISDLQVSSGYELPEVGQILVQASTTPQAKLPAAGALDTTPLDLTKDFYPFGEEPRFNATFYLALPEELARPSLPVKLKVTLRNPAGSTGTPKAVLDTGGAGLTWEMWDGSAWRQMTVQDGTATTASVTPFAKSGDILVTLPATLAPTEIVGVEGFWLRARLTQGNYGVPATYTPGTDKQGNTIYIPKDATFAPPVVRSLTAESAGSPKLSSAATACLTYNDFAYVDRTPIAAGRVPETFTPFSTTEDAVPALYLGFDPPFGNQPVTLYLQVEPPLPEDVAADQLAMVDRTTLAQTTWEYSGPGGWRPLGAIDETGALARRGVVGFAGPDDLVSRSCFGQTWCWLRLRWQRGYFPVPPRLRRVLPNTTWATQVVSIEDEILGSSNGDPDQAFTTAHTPVQPCQRVVVREREQPTDAERQALARLEGPDAVQAVPDATGQPDEIWVRWHAVPDLYGSGPRDRHYVIDRLTGEVRFGDGQRGMVPPPGQNNVRTSYRTGGGQQGNRAVGTVVQLTSGVPYVDSVTNPEPAEGGAPREPLDRLRARGPRALRHRDRAVTAQDLEDLAFEASTDVARVAAIVPRFDPYNLWLEPTAPLFKDEHRTTDAGRMGVIVVPNRDAARPTPSLGLLTEVQEHLLARCSPTADLWVAGPEWIRVTVRATLAATSLDTADAAAGRAREALERFLHPLTGGPLGQGWAFGRKPPRSDLFALLEDVDGVDHVVSLTMALEPETGDANRRERLRQVLVQTLTESSGRPPAPDDRRWLERALVYSGEHRITVALQH